MSWYYYKVTKDSFKNPKAIYNTFKRKVPHFGVEYPIFLEKLDWMKSTKKLKGNFVIAVEEYDSRFYYGELEWHRKNQEDVEIKVNTTVKIGGKLV